jgi:RNA polymerase sigma factor (sigma-70 family)
MSDAVDEWFIREVLIHEAALSLYLRRCWPHADDVHDLRQETYVRVYEAASRALPTSPKSFLFTTARHLMTDRLRRGRVVSIETGGDLEALSVLVDDLTPERRCSARQVLKRLADAFDRLPERCREVVWLRRVEEIPQRDVAQRLGISEKTVEKHVAKGIRSIAEHFYGSRSADGHSHGEGRLSTGITTKRTAKDNDKDVAKDGHEHEQQQTD